MKWTRQMEGKESLALRYADTLYPKHIVPFQMYPDVAGDVQSIAGEKLDMCVCVCEYMFVWMCVYVNKRVSTKDLQIFASCCCSSCPRIPPTRMEGVGG